ncbi:MAG: RIP metalloprotease RseP [Nitrosomonadales bacterium]|nr:RIP metalloprotease RseP [Nitrosomonadales bacterium]
MTTLLAFIGAIALLVVFHEFGHYWMARRCGVKVLCFSVGFGKAIYKKRFAGSDTEWVISAIPLGGYVRMLDEREAEVVPEELEYAFNRKPVLQRMAIVAAGPLANLLLAVLLYWILFIQGVPGLKPILGDVPKGTPAAVAQMQSGETIVSVNGTAIPTWQELRWKVLELALQQESGRERQAVEVSVETLNALGDHRFYMLDIGSLEARDMDGEFLGKLGLHPYQPVILPVIGKLDEGNVAQLAGLREGDRILSVDGVAVQYWREVVEVVRSHPGQSLRFDIRRGELMLDVTLIPQAVVESGLTIGKIGAAPQIDRAEWLALFTEVSYDPLEAFVQSLRKTWDTSVISLKMMGKMVMGEVSMKNLSGPITIADYAGQSAEMGMVAYLGFLALISVSLGILNLLPIPLLDGGHLLYYVAELIKGSPVSEQAWEVGQKIGIALLGTLMVFALYNDINRLIPG